MVDKDLALRIVDYLNELSNRDSKAIFELVNKRVRCNEKLATHPTCQVITVSQHTLVGVLGLLNGLCGIKSDGYGPIEAMVDNEKRSIIFRARFDN